jgi:putative phage-type endonuclease
MSHLTHFDRAGRLTASQASAALGLNPYMNRKELWRQITGKKPAFEGNAFTQYGNDCEAEALACFEARMGVLLEPGRFVPHPAYEWLGASPDGFIEGIPVEVKCPQKLHEKCPEHYLVQLHVQMNCCIEHEGWFGSWTPDAMMIERVEFDYEWWNGLILPGLNIFWNKYVLQDIEPPRGKFNPEKECK